jgi:hypothetical protein
LRTGCEKTIGTIAAFVIERVDLMVHLSNSH